MENIGFIFDLDGVLTDTAQFHHNAWVVLAQQMGLRFTVEDSDLLKGIARDQAVEIFLEVNGCQDKYSPLEKKELARLKNEAYLEQLEALSVSHILPGIPAFLQQAKENGIPMAVASASKNAPFVLKKLNLFDYFSFIADSSKISCPKPHPEIFLTCAHALGFSPKQCIGFEDAQAGIEAIHAAGMFSVGIGVAVTSVAPSLALCSTNELTLNLVLNAFQS